MARRENEVQASEDQELLRKTSATGLCADTIVLTMDGELRAGDIAPGDRIITRDAGMVVLRDVKKRRIVCDAVQIKAGSLGHKRPPPKTYYCPQEPSSLSGIGAQMLFLGCLKRLFPRKTCKTVNLSKSYRNKN